MQFITKDFKQLSLEELEEVRKEFRFVWLPSIIILLILSTGIFLSFGYPLVSFFTLTFSIPFILGGSILTLRLNQLKKRSEEIYPQTSHYTY